MHTAAHGCSHSSTDGTCFTSWRQRRAAFTQVTVKGTSRPDTPLSRTRDFNILHEPSPVGRNVADSTGDYPSRLRHLDPIRGLANDSVLDRFTQKWDSVSCSRQFEYYLHGIVFVRRSAVLFGCAFCSRGFAASVDSVGCFAGTTSLSSLAMLMRILRSTKR